MPLLKIFAIQHKRVLPQNFLEKLQYISKIQNFLTRQMKFFTFLTNTLLKICLACVGVVTQMILSERVREIYIYKRTI